MIAKFACSIVGVLHLYFAYKEINDWPNFAEKILGDRATNTFLTETNEMAKNQGTYNLFLAAGLILSTTGIFDSGSKNIALFLLFCVFVAGLVGWRTMKTPIFLIAQSAVSLVAIILCWNLLPN